MRAAIDKHLMARMATEASVLRPQMQIFELEFPMQSFA
jgi:hypothetical protein